MGTVAHVASVCYCNGLRLSMSGRAFGGIRYERRGPVGLLLTYSPFEKSLIYATHLVRS